MEFSYRIIEAADREAFKNYILPDMAQAASETDDGVIMVGAVSDGKEACGAAVLHNIYTAAGENANVWLEAINEQAEKLAGSLSGGTCTLWTQGIAVYNTAHIK